MRVYQQNEKKKKKKNSDRQWQKKRGQKKKRKNETCKLHLETGVLQLEVGDSRIQLIIVRIHFGELKCLRMDQSKSKAGKRQQLVNSE